MIWLILIAVVVGGVWGAVFGYVAYRAMRGHRDFTSASGLAADRYDVMVLDTEVERARRLVSQQGCSRTQPRSRETGLRSLHAGVEDRAVP
jgi:hypothetical protein